MKYHLYTWIVLILLLGCQPNSTPTTHPTGEGDAEGQGRVPAETGGSPRWDSAVTRKGEGLFIPRTASSPVDKKRLFLRIPSSVPTVGPRDALVTIVMFFDFKCHWCRRAEGLIGRVAKKYGKEVRVAYFNYPLPRHKGAHIAAEAGLEADAQGFFAKFKDKVFANANHISTANLLVWAREIGMDSAKLKRALARKRHVEAINVQLLAGRYIGIRGTPTILVNGRFFVMEKDMEISRQVLTALVTEEISGAKRLGVPRDKVYAKLTRTGVRNLAQLKGAGGNRVRFRKVVDPSKIYRIVRDFSGEMQMGAKEPLVTIVGFVDYQCPYCMKWNRTMKRLLKKHGSSVRLVLFHNPLNFHKRAMGAAMASLEVLSQVGLGTKFWAFHDTLHEHRTELTPENLAGWATKVAGADGAKVRAAIASMKYASRVSSAMTWARSFGVRGVPAFFVNGRFYGGARPYDELDKILKEARREARLAIKLNKTTRKNVYTYLVGSGETKAVWKMVEIPKRRRRPRLDTSKRYRVGIEGLPYIGDKNAPVVVAVGYDMLCPYCAKIFPLLLKLLDGDDKEFKGFSKGVKIVFLHYPLPFHMGSEKYHEALQEVFRQKGSSGVRKFLTYVQRAFIKSSKSLTVDAITGFAQAAGCNMKQFALAMSSRRHLALVRGTMKRARKVGVMGTPSVYINGKYVRRRSLPLFRRHIKGALAEAQRIIAGSSRVTARTYYKHLMRRATPAAVWIKQSK